MSTRAERLSDKAQNERHTKVLKELMSRADNKRCADCRKKVKSADLDSWTPEQIENMVRWGNGKANQYWEHQLPPNMEPPESNIDQWIRAKYERKQYAAKGPVPDPDTLPLPDGVAPVASSVAQPKAAPTIKPADGAAAAATTSSAAPSFANFNSPQQPAAAAPPQQSASQDLFDVFQSPPPATANGAAAAKPDLKNSILSLYGNAGSAPQAGGAGAAPMGTMNFASFSAAAGLGGGAAAVPPGYQQPQQQQQFGAFGSAPGWGQQQQQQPQGAQFFGAGGGFGAPPPQQQQQQQQGGAVGGIPDFLGIGGGGAGQQGQGQGQQGGALGGMGSRSGSGGEWGAFQ
ncbi:hypothetical protein HDV00_003420 [Rhizophlyctis rosea]|nr:hypothetical protein HDV00_003420 [Rhizophlyctis rosea]